MIKIFKYKIHKSSYIGFSWVFPKNMILDKNSYIGNFNIIIHINHFVLGEFSKLGRLNWISGFPTNTNSKHFSHQKDRRAEFIVGKHSAITKNHHFDCTNLIQIKDYVTIGGYNSQFLTHSIDIYENRQNSKPIYIEDYCFVGTNVVVLGGSNLPSFSVLGAKSLLNKNYVDSYFLYAGNPARPIKEISHRAKYFHRSLGFVN